MAGAGFGQVGGYLGKGYKYKAPLLYSRVRDSEYRVVGDGVAIKEDIDIQGPWPFPSGLCSIPPRLVLQGVDIIQKLVRGQLSLPSKDCVQELRLFCIIPRLGFKN